MKFVNLTKHKIRIVTPGFAEGAEPQLDITVMPEESHAHVKYFADYFKKMSTVGPFAWITRLYSTASAQIEGLPDPQEGVIYLVDHFVHAALLGYNRRDVYTPDYSPGTTVQDPSGFTCVTRLICAV